MKFLSLLALALPLAVSAAPAVERRQSQHCGQWDVVAVGSTYSLVLDQWGSSGATSGKDCASVSSTSGSNVAWSTTWNWVGGNGVKSFTNIQLNAGLNKQLSAIKSMPVCILTALQMN
jgi:xyloglucan-specific endo-beta-1,4-glucanase